MTNSKDKSSVASTAPVSFPRWREDPGDCSGYRPGRSGKRIPVVLSPKKCQALFDQLSGTSRLMAQLLYGTGLRLMELLRLRIQDINFEQSIVTVRQGKGGKDRVSVLPERLRRPLLEQRERLQALFEADRRMELPGVWLPPAVETKYLPPASNGPGGNTGTLSSSKKSGKASPSRVWRPLPASCHCKCSSPPAPLIDREPTGNCLSFPSPALKVNISGYPADTNRIDLPQYLSPVETEKEET